MYKTTFVSLREKLSFNRFIWLNNDTFFDKKWLAWWPRNYQIKIGRREIVVWWSKTNFAGLTRADLRWEFIKENKKVRKQENKESFFFFSWSLSWASSCFLSCFLDRFLSRVLVFLFSYFLVLLQIPTSVVSHIPSIII